MSLSNNPLELLVKIGVNTEESKANLNAQLEKLTGQLKDLNVGITFNDKDMKDTIANIGDMKKKLEEVAHTSQEVAKKQREIEAAAGQAADQIGISFGKSKDRILTSLGDVKKAFEGQDFTVKTDIDIKSGQEVLKGFQVDVKKTGDIVERTTYQLREKGDQMAFEPVSKKVVDKAQYDMSKGFNDTTDSLRQLRQEGKISEQMFESLSKKTSEVSESSGFKELGKDIKQATIDHKQFVDAKKEEEATEKRLQDARQRTLDQLERMSHSGKLDHSQAGAFGDSVNNAK